MWTCECGVTNKDRSLICHRCGGQKPPDADEMNQLGSAIPAEMGEAPARVEPPPYAGPSLLEKNKHLQTLLQEPVFLDKVKVTDLTSRPGTRDKADCYDATLTAEATGLLLKGLGGLEIPRILAGPEEGSLFCPWSEVRDLGLDFLPEGGFIALLGPEVGQVRLKMVVNPTQPGFVRLKEILKLVEDDPAVEAEAADIKIGREDDISESWVKERMERSANLQLGVGLIFIGIGICGILMALLIFIISPGKFIVSLALILPSAIFIDLGVNIKSMPVDGAQRPNYLFSNADWFHEWKK